MNLKYYLYQFEFTSCKKKMINTLFKPKSFYSESHQITRFNRPDR